MEPIRNEDIAVIGLSGRFPGAQTIDRYWQNLCEGRESIHQFSEQELLSAGIDEAVFTQNNYVKAKGILDDVEYFDATFFGMSALEAKILDPQHRILLMCAWEAFENAGYVLKENKNRVGVFASTGMSFYLLKNILANHDFLKNVDEYQLLLGNDKDFLATRISYLLNLQGPSVNVQTGCSSSLVSVHYACQSLLNGECDLALAGGVSISIPQQQGYLYRKEMIGSPDGHCYAFDQRAQGTVKSNGAGMVLLKPLTYALRDNDHVYAVIRGTAVNNDGANKVGYTAPSVSQQAAVIKEALQMADVSLNDIEYIETHGTGTLLGDPIEISALVQAFSKRDLSERLCALTSLKTNIGHLDVAAGIASLIKACLAVYHGKIPPSLNFTQLNSKINLTNTPFYINTELKEWQPHSHYRCAGVSSFGIGGTNAHIILQQPPKHSIKKKPIPEPELFVFSAKSQQSVQNNINNMVAYLRNNHEVGLADISYTLQTGRANMPYRIAFSAKDANDFENKVHNLDINNLTPIKNTPSLVFMFSGQGSQYINMGLNLYTRNHHFKVAFDECLAALRPHMAYDLRNILFPNPLNIDNAANELKQTINAQPALFAIEYALSQCYLAYGIQPKATVGHSIGEYAAAVLAGIFTLQDAAKIVALRGQLIQCLPSGEMLSIHLGADKIMNLIPEDIDIALINSPTVTVVSGTHSAIADFSKQLLQLNIRHQLLHTSHAFHSRMLDTALDEFSSVIASVKRHPPQILMASNVTGNWITTEQACSVDYWVQQLRGMVKFSQCVTTIQQQLTPIFIEIGPGRTLQSLVFQHGITHVYNSLPSASENRDDDTSFIDTLGKIWSAGIPITPIKSGKRIPLPTYGWDLQRYWIEPDLINQRPNKKITRSLNFNKNIKLEIQTIWENILGTELLSEDDNFFNLGGNSLSAIQLIDQLPEIYHERVNVVHLYQYPKFIHFVRYIESLITHAKDDSIYNDDSHHERQLFSRQEEL